MSVTSFKIALCQETLDDLHARLARTRWPDEIEGAGWDYGTNRAYLQELMEYWRTRFDWRAQEAALNRFAHFRAEIEGIGIHFIHERGKGPNPLPLIITHGWPSTFYQMVKILPLLTDPQSHGGKAEDAFDVVVPSIPGFGFSDRPKERGMHSMRVGDLWVKLMQELGYDRFGAQGGDLGSGITEMLASAHPEVLLGIHLTDVPYWHLFSVLQEDLSDAEKQYLEAGQAWSKEEGAYAMVQATRPQTLAFGLSDSPAGLAAWIVEKFRAWSDCGGEVERRFSKDELLTNLTIYWATETIHSSCRFYYEMNRAGWPEEGKRIEVPTAVAVFLKDHPPPRAFAERVFNIQRWTEMPRGGHFAAMEEPELLVEDIRAFFRTRR